MGGSSAGATSDFGSPDVGAAGADCCGRPRSEGRAGGMGAAWRCARAGAPDSASARTQTRRADECVRENKTFMSSTYRDSATDVAPNVGVPDNARSENLAETEGFEPSIGLYNPITV